jgi:hypothetical protein
MSALGKRQTTRAIARPNAARALRRIEEELDTLLNNTPTDVVVDPAIKERTRDALASALRRIYGLYSL